MELVEIAGALKRPEKSLKLQLLQARISMSSTHRTMVWHRVLFRHSRQLESVMVRTARSRSLDSTSTDSHSETYRPVTGMPTCNVTRVRQPRSRNGSRVETCLAESCIRKSCF